VSPSSFRFFAFSLPVEFIALLYYPCPVLPFWTRFLSPLLLNPAILISDSILSTGHICSTPADNARCRNNGSIVSRLAPALSFACRSARRPSFCWRSWRRYAISSPFAVIALNYRTVFGCFRIRWRKVECYSRAVINSRWFLWKSIILCLLVLDTTCSAPLERLLV